MKVSRIVDYYNNRIPKELSIQEFYDRRNSLPIYPQPRNATNIILSENWWLILFLWFPPIWIILLVNGTFESIGNQYSAIKRQNEITRLYFDAIYTSRTYDEYLEKYKRIR